MAGAYMNEASSVDDLFANPDDAVGPTPEPFERYGQPLPSQWSPIYKKPMRTASRKLRIYVIGASWIVSPLETSAQAELKES
ncbi:hypothetical protein LTR22_028059 [Elasticomyces elasticus]|nr:hypothetical protein LTR22_028059 [Elasticomyces elasticus]